MTGHGRRVRAAAAQLGPASDTGAETVERIVSLIQQAAADQVKLIVFPEMALTPYFPVAEPPSVGPFAEVTVPSLLTRPIFDAARAGELVLVLPLVRAADGACFNSAIVVDSDGDVLGNYDKTHIPKGERPYFAPGQTGFRVWPTSGGRVGALICADRSFPEGWRLLALGDAQIVAAPYNTSLNVPHNRRSGRSSNSTLREQQELRMRGSANMNGFYVVAAGKAGVELATQYIGDSMIISPWGDVLARAQTDGDELVCADIDLDVVDEARRGLDLAHKRRPDVYAELAAPLPAAVAALASARAS